MLDFRGDLVRWQSMLRILGDHEMPTDVNARQIARLDATGVRR